MNEKAQAGGGGLGDHLKSQSKAKEPKQDTQSLTSLKQVKQLSYGDDRVAFSPSMPSPLHPFQSGRLGQQLFLVIFWPNAQFKEP